MSAMNEPVPRITEGGKRRVWKLMDLDEPRLGITRGLRSVIGIQPIGAWGSWAYKGESFEDRPAALVALSEAQAHGRKVALFVEEHEEGAATMDARRGVLA